jgi:hypothetical protein
MPGKRVSSLWNKFNFWFWKKTGVCLTDNPKVTDADYAYIYRLLYPARIKRLSREHHNLAVLGALDAYREVRGEIRAFLKYLRARGALGLRDLKVAQALRAMGYVGNIQDVYYDSEQRELAQAMWPNGQVISGDVLIPVFEQDQAKVDRAVIRLCSKFLVDFPKYNKAYLDGAIWQRVTSEVLLNLGIRGNIRSVVIKPMTWTDKEHRKQNTRMLKRLLQIEQNDLRELSEELLIEWMEEGFIVSSAGIMVSCSSSIGTYNGTPPLVRSNGIPLSVLVHKIRDSQVCVSLSFDHRVFDGEVAGAFYNYLEENLLKEILNG